MELYPSFKEISLMVYLFSRSIQQLFSSFKSLMYFLGDWLTVFLNSNCKVEREMEKC